MICTHHYNPMNITWPCSHTALPINPGQIPTPNMAYIQLHIQGHLCYISFVLHAVVSISSNTAKKRSIGVVTFGCIVVVHDKIWVLPIIW